MSVCGKLGNTRRHCKSRTATWLTMLRLYICTRSFRQWAQQLKVIKCSISTSGRFINEFWMGSVHSTEVHPGNGTFPSGLTFALLSVGARKSSWPVSPSAPHGIQSRDPRGPEEVCPTSPGCAPAPHLPGAGRPRRKAAATCGENTRVVWGLAAFHHDIPLFWRCRGEQCIIRAAVALVPLPHLTSRPFRQLTSVFLPLLSFPRLLATYVLPTRPPFGSTFLGKSFIWSLSGKQNI